MFTVRKFTGAEVLGSEGIGNVTVSCIDPQCQSVTLRIQSYIGNIEGFVMSDWNAQHTGIASALAGLDMAMPYGREYWSASLAEAVRNGSVPDARQSA